MRNRIAHYYWTIDDDIVWTVIAQHAARLQGSLAGEFEAAQVAAETVQPPGGS